MIFSDFNPTVDELRNKITPLLNKSLMHIIYWILLINIILLCLAVSDIFLYAKVITYLFILSLNVFSYARYNSARNKFLKAMHLTPKKCLVNFKLESVGDGYVVMADIYVDEEFMTRACTIQNIASSIQNQKSSAYLFSQNDVPEMVVTEDLKYFAIM